MTRPMIGRNGRDRCLHFHKQQIIVLIRYTEQGAANFDTQIAGAVRLDLLQCLLRIDDTRLLVER